MSLSSANSRDNYQGNNTKSNYEFSFKVFSEEDLRVIIEDSDNNTTILSNNTDYTINDVGEDTGSIDLVDDSQEWIDESGYLDSGYTLTLRRVIALKQETDIRNSGSFYPEVHEDTFDRLVMISQQQQDDLDRSIKLTESVDPSTFDMDIPSSLVGSSNCTIITNENGNGLAIGPTSSEISNAQGYALAASTSKDEAASSATAAATSASESSDSATISEGHATNAATSEENAATSETNAATSATAAATSATEAATSATAAENSYNDTLAILSTEVSNKESISNNVTDTATSITIDVNDHVGMEISIITVRGSSSQFNRLVAIYVNEAWTLTNETHLGDAGISFTLSETSGVGTINYTTDDSDTGTIYIKTIKYGV